MRHLTKVCLTIPAAMLVAAGCDPTINGNEGNIELTYDEGPVLEANASSPLAVGAKLDYAGHRQPADDSDQSDQDPPSVTFSSAMSSNDTAIQVDDGDGIRLTLAGVGAGRATIDVDAGDGLISDSFEAEAADVDELGFDDLCAPDGPAAYLVDHDINLKYTMRADDQVAVGYGYYPVEFEPAEAATVGETEINGLLPLHTGQTPGSVTVGSTISDDETALRVVEKADITGIELYESGLYENANISADQTLVLHFLPTAPGGDNAQAAVPVCQSDLDMQVSSETPDVCEVTYDERSMRDEGDSILQLYEPRAVILDGKSDGTCTFTVTIPAANGGEGVSKSVTFQ